MANRKTAGTAVLYARVPAEIHQALQRISTASGMTIAEVTGRVLALGLGIDPGMQAFDVALAAERERAAPG